MKDSGQLAFPARAHTTTRGDVAARRARGRAPARRHHVHRRRRDRLRVRRARRATARRRGKRGKRGPNAERTRTTTTTDSTRDDDDDDARRREIATTRGGWRAKTRRRARREPREDERATDETRIRDARATRLTRAGHEVTLQCERDERARAVLDARFQGVRRAREASEIEALPRDVDVLVCGLMTREYEGSWRESWTRDGAAGALKHALRLGASARVPWLVIEARGKILDRGVDGSEAPLIHEFVSELERAGYAWAHRTVAAAAFGVPDVAARVLLVASRCGDPRDVLLTEDAGALKVDARDPADEHTFVFNRHPERGLCAYADVCEGFHPEPEACMLTAAGGLMPLTVHDAERLQGLPPGWTMTTRPSVQGSQGEELTARWDALAKTYGCVPSSYWLGTRLADPYALKFSADAVPFRESVPHAWPGAAYNVGHGRASALCSPFVREITELPCLGTFISTSFFEGGPLVPKETAVACARVLRESGWEVPPQLEALENGEGEIAVVEPRVKNEQAPAVEPLTIATPAARAQTSRYDEFVSAPPALVERTLPLIKTKSGHLIVDQDEVKRSSNFPIDIEAKRYKRSITPSSADIEPGSPGSTPGTMTFIAGVGLAAPRRNQLVWAKLPGHPFWPGLRADLDKDFIPADALAMARENEVLVVFFGENSFGWLRAEHCLDFTEHYASKSRDPARNKARFQAAVKQANEELQIRETLHERDRLRKMATQSTAHKFRSRGGSPMPELKGCTCKSCTSISADGSESPKCIRVEAAEKASRGHTGAKLTIQGRTIIGKQILVFWPLDRASYPGKIVDYDPVELRHCVEYAEDGVKEFLSLWKEDVTLPPGERLGPTLPEADEAGADLLLGLTARG